MSLTASILFNTARPVFIGTVRTIIEKEMKKDLLAKDKQKAFNANSYAAAISKEAILKALAGGEIYTTDDLKTKTGFSKSAIQRYMIRLESDGLVERIVPGRPRPSSYRLIK